MSLTGIKALLRDAGFPRASGDEPARDEGVQVLGKFSPRERG